MEKAIFAGNMRLQLDGVTVVFNITDPCFVVSPHIAAKRTIASMQYALCLPGFLLFFIIYFIVIQTSNYNLDEGNQ